MTTSVRSDTLEQFGPELRRRRIAAGRSLGELSKLVHYSKGHLSKVENGTKTAGLDLAQRCDTILEAAGELVALARSHRAAVDPLPSSDLGEEWLVGSDPAGQPDLPEAGDGALMKMTASAAEPGPADDRTLADFRGIFDALRGLSQRVAPAELVPPLITLTRTLRQRQAQPQMLMLASRFAELTGWMIQETGDDNASIRWTNYATDLAALAGDDQMTAYRFLRYADVALYRHDPIATLEYAQQAQREPGSSRVYSLAAQREAQGHAIAGDYSRCRRALDQAAHYLEKEAQETDAGKPTLGTSTIVDPITMTRGWCLHDLARSKEAVAVLTSEVERIPRHAVRARARYGVRLALALASIRELEQSRAILEPILPMLPRIDSATIRTDLRRLSQTCNRWTKDQAVRVILPQISAALHRVAPGSMP